MKDSWHTRCTLVTLLAMTVLAPLLVWGTFQGSRATHNAPIRWIPASHPQRQIYQRFLNDFRTEQAVVVSWLGCTVDDQRLRYFRDAILSPRRTARGDDHLDLFRQVVSGCTMLDYLGSEPFELSPRRAIKRLQGTLIGPDENTSCAVVMLTDYGARRSKSVVDAILNVVEKDLGIDRDDCFLGGSPVGAAAIDAASALSIKLFLIPSTVVVLLFARLCLRSWPLSLVVVATALFGQGMVLALVYFLGVTMNAVLTVMAPLILVLTVSAGVHLINYYHDEARLRGQRGAVQRALAHGWVPCMLAALTTAIGLGSLMVSNIIPVSQFGLFAGVGVLTTTGLLFLVVPGAMVKWPVVPKVRDVTVVNRVPTENRPTAEQSDSRQNPNQVSAWDHYAKFVCRFSPLILAICLAWMLFSVWGLSKIRTSVNVLNLLAPGSRTVRDYQWLEENVAPLLPIEIVLTVDGRCRIDLLQQIELVRDLEVELAKLQDLKGTMSAATFFPSIPEPGGVRRMARRVLLRKKLETQSQALVDAHYLYESCDVKRTIDETTPQQRSWRITARAPESANLDYGLFLERLRARVELVLERHGEQANGISATYTGVMPLVYNVQRILLSDLISSYSTALVLVGIVMIVVQRSVIAGLVAMLPNMFPTLVLFGTMGWLKKPVDIGSMMTASVALGIAVDGTLHFLYWFRREVGQGNSRRDAVSKCYRHCGKAITQTAIICGIGLLVYSLSGFVPTRRFAWMMCALLTAALVGDLLLLPALLVSPLGKFFLPNRATSELVSVER